MKSVFAISLGLGIAGVSTAAFAGSVSFENFNYSGTVTSYSSLVDAQNDTNGTTTQIQTATNGSNSTLPDARDGSIYVDSSSGEVYFTTLWYYNPQDTGNPAVNGFGNPNNSNNGFVQLYDADGSSTNTFDMGFNSDGTEFSFSTTGGFIDPYSRLWNAPAVGGPAGDTAGNFLSYSLDFNATFNTADASGSRSDQPSAISGGFSGLFENTFDSKYYVADFSFALGSSAQAGDYFYPDSGATTFAGSTDTLFAADVAPAAVPLPAGLPMLFAALGGLGILRRRKAKAC